MLCFRDFSSMFPAQAGVILPEIGYIDQENDVPRAGGGDPGYSQVEISLIICSPRRRG